MSEKEKIIDKLKKYKYQENEKFNIFKIVEMREQSHTRLLAWLLDVKGKTPADIQYSFLKEFLSKYYYNNDVEIDNIMSILCNDLKVDVEHQVLDENEKKCGKIDIILYSKKADLLLIIENKLDAKICTINKETQIERYYNYIKHNKKFSDFTQPKFLYICIYSKDLKNKYLKNIKMRGEYFSKVSAELLLSEFNYNVAEHSDIILLLYKTVENTSDSLIKEIIKQYINYWEDNKFGGYTKIIDGRFSWDICNSLGISYDEL